MRNKKLIILFSVICAITLLIVLNSVIFSVGHVNAYCYNSSGENTAQKVLESHNIKKHKNIFLLSEEDAIKSVESKVPNVRVINVEKKFPNTVFINYVELSEYVKIYSGGNTYFCSNDGKILRKVEGISNDKSVIELTIKGELLSKNEGDEFLSTVDSDVILVTSLLASLERLGYRTTVVDLISKIDISGNVNIMVTTTTGMVWKLIGAENMTEKLQIALSVYVNKGESALSDEDKRTGMLILSGYPVKCSLDKGGAIA